MKSLFEIGLFELHSGEQTDWRINAETLSDDDLAAIASIMSSRIGIFSAVEGVPTGGLRLAEAFRPYVFRPVGPFVLSIPVHTGPSVLSIPIPILIVDDVLTTGNSMESQRAGRAAIGVVIFARGTPPPWVDAFWYSY